MSISILSTDVIDQIAAGEVVERPAHLVKELVENSLDAGARKITIDFSQGGRSITVTDDGHGIAPQELPLALERFATSKISSADDLWKLNSYGFRGEALASISSVSRLTLFSRTPKSEVASRLVCEFGRRSAVNEVGGTLGTRISVEDLFANVPARLKFMKSAAAEHQQIKLTLKALSLCHPQVEFQIFENHELSEIYSATSSLAARAAQVLNAKKLFFHSREYDNIHVDVAFTSPQEVAKTSKNIWLFVQDRWVQDRTLLAAVMEAYRNLLMHGEYPIAAVWLRLPPSEVDVNIHPSKSAVKFADSQKAFRSVQGTLREALEAAPWLQGIVGPSAPMSPSFHVEERTENLSFAGSSFEKVQYAQRNLDLQKLSELAESRPALPRERPGDWSRLQVLAQAHLTYLVCQSADKLIFIDQHAAHERVMFERLMSSWKTGGIEVQDFLFPLAVDMTAAQMEALMAQSQELKKLGLHIESLGPQTLGVQAAPMMIKESALPEALQKMADELVDRGGSFAMEKMMADLCARLACHSAVRAGQSLSLEQMTNLLVEMDEFPLTSFCPHGRPVSVEYPFYDLEKDFGRIV